MNIKFSMPDFTRVENIRGFAYFMQANLHAYSYAKGVDLGPNILEWWGYMSVAVPTLIESAWQTSECILPRKNSLEHIVNFIRDNKRKVIASAVGGAFYGLSTSAGGWITGYLGTTLQMNINSIK